jgi:hypothetical protein
LRSDRQHGSRRRVVKVFDRRREKAVPRRIGIVLRNSWTRNCLPTRFRH